MEKERLFQETLSDKKRLEDSSLERLVGLLGNPVAHSLSPVMQNAAFRALNINYRYLPFRVIPEDFDMAMSGLASLGAVGANITVPHKERAFNWVKHLDPSAARTGAVNTVLFNSEGALGYNTDISGVRKALSTIPIKTGRALLLGAGGAARAVLCALIDEGFEQIAISNRTEGRAASLLPLLADESSGKSKIRHSKTELIPWSTAPSFSPDLIINTTSLGLHNSPWPHETLQKAICLAEGGAILDLVYTRGRETPLCHHARISGIPFISGEEVLLHQGTAAFELFTKRDAPVAVMRKALEAAASQQ